jgi:hypothetical protein
LAAAVFYDLNPACAAALGAHARRIEARRVETCNRLDGNRESLVRNGRARILTHTPPH